MKTEKIPESAIKETEADGGPCGGRVYLLAVRALCAEEIVVTGGVINLGPVALEGSLEALARLVLSEESRRRPWVPASV